MADLKRRISIGRRPSQISSFPFTPQRTASRSARGRSFQGLLVDTCIDRKRLMTQSAFQPSPRCIDAAHTPMAPSLIDSCGAVTTRSSSISGRDPSPLHSVHAPIGELNEKACGVSSSKEIPHDSHALRCEKICSRAPPRSKSATAIPSPSFNAASTESVTRERSDFR